MGNSGISDKLIVQVEAKEFCYFRKCKTRTPVYMGFSSLYNTKKPALERKWRAN